MSESEKHIALDRIKLEGLSFYCVIGINDWERVAKQVIELDLTLYADLSAAAASDDISDTVNYRTISRNVRDFVEGSAFGLVEKLADGVARICLEDEKVRRVDVSLRKLGALRLGRSVGLDITRTRND
jgi:FolB domain-containing protein